MTIEPAREPTPSTEAELRMRILDLVGEYADRFHASVPFEPGAHPVPVSGKVYGAAEMRALVESSLDFWLTTGRFNDSFESRLARIIGVKRAFTANSGSSANLLAVTALTSHLLGERALKPGDEVITCATGFPTTVNPILQNRLIPVFLDVDIPTYNMDTSLLEDAITPRTRAIVLAHTLGNPFNLDRVTEVARRHNLLVVEDCCDALGATWGGRPVGAFGDVSTLSFYPAHHITTGEGGAVLTADARLARAIESLRDWGRDCWCPPGRDNTCKKRFGWQLGDLPFGYDHKYTYGHVGYNLKMTDMQAAIGVAQLDRLDGFIATRRANFSRLSTELADLQDVLVLPQATPGSDPSWFGFPLTVADDAPFTRDALAIHLNERKIATRLLFGGNLLRQPFMRGQEHRVVGTLDRSDRVMRQTLWIGVYPGIGPAALDYVIDTLRGFCRR